MSSGPYRSAAVFIDGRSWLARLVKTTLLRLESGEGADGMRTKADVIAQLVRWTCPNLVGHKMQPELVR